MSAILRIVQLFIFAKKVLLKNLDIALNCFEDNYIKFNSGKNHLLFQGKH